MYDMPLKKNMYGDYVYYTSAGVIKYLQSLQSIYKIAEDPTLQTL